MIDPQDILEKITSLPLSEWSFKGDDIRHIGPMAQDFMRLSAMEKTKLPSMPMG